MSVPASLSAWLADIAMSDLETAFNDDDITQLEDFEGFEGLDEEELNKAMAEDLKNVLAKCKGPRLRKLKKAIPNLIATMANAPRDATSAAARADLAFETSLVPVEELSAPTREIMQMTLMTQPTRCQELLVKELVEIRNEHHSVRGCSQLLSTFVAQSDSGKDLSYLCKMEGSDDGVMSKEQAAKKASDSVRKLAQSCHSLDDKVQERKNAYADLAHLRGALREDTLAWQGALRDVRKDDTVAQRLRPQTFKSIHDRAQEHHTLVKAGMVNTLIGQKGDDGVVESCKGMLETIVFSTVVDAAARAKHKEAVEQLKEAEDKSLAAAARFKRAGSILARLKSARESLELEYTPKITRLDNEVKQAQKDLNRWGTGIWRRQGSPGNDKEREMSEKFDNNKFDQLSVYYKGSSGFKIWKDETKCPDHQAAYDRLQDLEERLGRTREAFEKAKEAHASKNDALVEEAEKDQEQARADVDREAEQLQKSKENLNKGLCNLPPAQQAECEMLQKLSSLIRSNAENFTPCQSDLTLIEPTLAAIVELTKPGEDGQYVEVPIVLQFVDALLKKLSENVSKIALLEKLGPASLKRFLTPPVDPTQGGQAHIEGKSRHIENTSGGYPASAQAKPITDK